MGRACGELNIHPDLDLCTTHNQDETLVKKEKTKLDPETQCNTQIPRVQQHYSQGLVLYCISLPKADETKYHKLMA